MRTFSILGGLCLVGILISILGCSTPEQRRQNEIAREQRASADAARQERSREAQIEHYRRQCLQYGFAAQSLELAKCVQDESRRAQAQSQSQQATKDAVLRCTAAMFARGPSYGEGLRNANKCETDPNAHLRQADARPAGNTSSRETCQYTGDRANGMNRICYYSCSSGTAANTVGASAICPLTLQR